MVNLCIMYIRALCVSVCNCQLLSIYVFCCLQLPIALICKQEMPQCPEGVRQHHAY